ncbi:A-kinase anchor protein inhibitor 1 [Macaca mulatta]
MNAQKDVAQGWYRCSVLPSKLGCCFLPSHAQNADFHLHAYWKMIATPEGFCLHFLKEVGKVQKGKGEKPGNEPEEVKLQNASKQIVQNAILRAVQQVSQESQRREERISDNQGHIQLGVGELTKKHEKK